MQFYFIETKNKILNIYRDIKHIVQATKDTCTD